MRGLGSGLMRCYVDASQDGILHDFYLVDGEDQSGGDEGWGDKVCGSASSSHSHCPCCAAASNWPMVNDLSTPHQPEHDMSLGQFWRCHCGIARRAWHAAAMSSDIARHASTCRSLRVSSHVPQVCEGCQTAGEKLDLC